MPSPPVVVGGGGIAGMACARALHTAEVPVTVLDRGRRPGGRLASRTLHGRAVDLGASYLTASEGSAFAAVVADRTARGLARPWTDTFAVAGPDGIEEAKSGPLRYAAPGGLHTLVTDLDDGLDVHCERTVTRVDTGPSVDGDRRGDGAPRAGRADHARARPGAPRRPRCRDSDGDGRGHPGAGARDRTGVDRRPGSAGQIVMSIGLVIIGNATSTGNLPAQFLPAWMEPLAHVLPSGVAVRALRGATYFDGDGVPVAFVVLGLWFVVPMLVIGLFDVVSRRRATHAEPAPS